jgi:hypothetical protein
MGGMRLSGLKGANICVLSVRPIIRSSRQPPVGTRAALQRFSCRLQGQMARVSRFSSCPNGLTPHPQRALAKCCIELLLITRFQRVICYLIAQLVSAYSYKSSASRMRHAMTD